MRFSLRQSARVLGLTAAMALAASASTAQTPLKFTLDWRIEGPAAPFLVPLDRGYYQAEGLDVTVEAGTGSIETINRVVNGGYDIGFGDINAAIKFRDQNPNVDLRAIFVLYNTPAYSILARKSRGIAKPKDLEGKKLGAPAADAAYAQWPIFAKLNDIDVSKVKIENIGFPLREPMLAAGEVDAVTGFAFSTFVNLRERGVIPEDIVVMEMADYGLKLYGNAIVVNPKFLAEKPEAVKGFLRAFLKGLKDTVKEPGAAVESVLRRNPTAIRDVELGRLQMALKENIVTPEVREHGYGGVTAARFAEALQQIALGYTFKGKTAGSTFDPSFLPPQADRAVD
jgi:NitT/TauT family transport system substrate-binding protein